MTGVLRATALTAVVVAMLACSSCGGSSPATERGTTQPASTPRAAGSRTVWLCRPGVAGDPCTTDLATTFVEASGATRVEHPTPAKSPPVDCFYVYPTVSLEPGTNADLRVGFEERAVAIAQASRFSQVCRVYAPMYRQLTLGAILKPGGVTAAGALTAYRSLLAGFRDYLARFNHGRGIVFIGHSQGASVLISLLRNEVDPDPALRRRLVSALLIGGNVTVPAGRDMGGDFQHIPACRSMRQAGCVVAYSSFERTPPADSYFGRVGSGLNPFAQRRSGRPLQVLCVNPAAPGGGRGSLEPYFPVSSLGLLGLQGGSGTAPATPWVAYPEEYVARCDSAGGASWLQVDRVESKDARPRLTESDGPRWGLHTVDVSIALGNLVALVRDQTAAYVR
ncbi:MAG: DUF3089 domain-containing protein [Gaiellaceae bacterium]